MLKYFKWIHRNTEGVRLTLHINVFLGILNVCFNMAFIVISKRLVDIATRVSPGDFVFWCIMLCVISAVRIAMNAYRIRLENVSLSKMNFIIRRRLYSDLTRTSWEGRSRMHSGDTLNRLFTDVDSVSKLLCSESPSMATTIFQLVMAMGLMCILDARLALVIILTTPLLILFSKVFFSRVKQVTANIRSTESSIQSHIQESLQHKEIIQSFGREGTMESKLDSLQDNEFGDIMKRTNYNIFSRILLGTAFTGGYIAAFLWGVTGIWKGTITFGMMTAFLQLVGQIQSPILNLTRQIPSFVYAAASIDRLTELSDTPKEEKSKPVTVEGVPGIVIDNISFRYTDGEKDIFHGFSAEFPPGSRTSIIGETGAGKSTLIRLMLSLLKPQEGHIWFTDKNGKRIEASAGTRSNIVFVPQGNTLFSGTIRENLLLGNPEADEQQMWKALDTSVASFVRGLPDGLDTRCGEMGFGLSEGQAQRIAIARALLRKGGVLLLDEFSSSLDPATEEKLMENLSKEVSGKTMIFITHREKITEYCDSILRIG